MSIVEKFKRLTRQLTARAAPHMVPLLGAIALTTAMSGCGALLVTSGNNFTLDFGFDEEKTGGLFAPPGGGRTYMKDGMVVTEYAKPWELYPIYTCGIILPVDCSSLRTPLVPSTTIYAPPTPVTLGCDRGSELISFVSDGGKAAACSNGKDYTPIYALTETSGKLVANKKDIIPDFCRANLSATGSMGGKGRWQKLTMLVRTNYPLTSFNTPQTNLFCAMAPNPATLALTSNDQPLAARPQDSTARPTSAPTSPYDRR